MLADLYKVDKKLGKEIEWDAKHIEVGEGDEGGLGVQYVVRVYQYIHREGGQCNLYRHMSKHRWALQCGGTVHTINQLTINGAQVQRKVVKAFMKAALFKAPISPSWAIQRLQNTTIQTDYTPGS